MNTTTSMGRLTLNVLLSFAQFEREVAGERISDKLAASRVRGMWVTGPRPLGYRVVNQRLIVHEKEAALVRRMYERYCRIGSARRVAHELAAAGVVNHLGHPINVSYVTYHLKNRLYLGETTIRGARVPGTHEAIVCEKLWRRVEAVRAQGFTRRQALRRTPVPALLKGIIFTASGRAMLHTFTTSRGKLYRYYKSTLADQKGSLACEVGTLRADQVEAAVVAQVEQLVVPCDLRAARVRPREPRSEKRTARDVERQAAEREGLVRRLVDRVEIGPDTLTLRLKTGGVVRSRYGR